MRRISSKNLTKSKPISNDSHETGSCTVAYGGGKVPIGLFGVIHSTYGSDVHKNCAFLTVVENTRSYVDVNAALNFTFSYWYIEHRA